MSLYIEKSVVYRPPPVPLASFEAEIDARQTNWPLVLSGMGLCETRDNKTSLVKMTNELLSRMSVKYGNVWARADSFEVFGTHDYLRDAATECTQLVCKAADAFLKAGGTFKNNIASKLYYASMTPETRLTIYPCMKLHHLYFSEVTMPLGVAQSGSNAVVNAIELARYAFASEPVTDAYILTADKFRLPIPRTVSDMAVLSDAASALHLTSNPSASLFEVIAARVVRTVPTFSQNWDEWEERLDGLANAIDKEISSFGQIKKTDIQPLVIVTGLSPKANSAVTEKLSKVGHPVQDFDYSYDLSNANLCDAIDICSDPDLIFQNQPILIINACVTGAIGYLFLSPREG